jgi:hypothetical protein
MAIVKASIFFIKLLAKQHLGDAEKKNNRDSNINVKKSKIKNLGVVNKKIGETKQLVEKCI